MNYSVQKQPELPALTSSPVLAAIRRHAPKPRHLPTLVLLAVMLCFMAAPGLFAGYDPLAESGPHLAPPSAAHWLGTDELGRDLYARIVHGTRYSLSGALVAVGLGFIIGSAWGLTAGVIGARGETVLMRLIDIILSVPALLLSFTIVILLGSGILTIAVAVGITSIAGFARLARAQAVRIRHSDYIEAAYGAGATRPQVLARHILPNALPVLLAYARLQFGHALLQIATLGFLGYGVAPPTPEWGVLIAEGRNYVATAWWLTVMPGLFIIITALSAGAASRLLNHREA